MLDQAKAFLNALSENADVRAYMADYALPEGMDKEEGLIAVAAHFGYEITKEDLIKACEKHTGELDAARQAAEKEVEELSMDDLDKVAVGDGSYVGVANCLGTPTPAVYVEDIELGEKHENCKFSYRDRENCWLGDACDITFMGYIDYVCRNEY